ncbi:alpha/beta fold hydrolase [Dictyobacter kobayashii]|uniref:Alpha/beta hydrolase n=1 Tax=Dictyobacter kobayashii TaxID=2014872 RepID=A0A402AGW7_9CHLR|nr:alpha/beta hydrolase [Dictyobacter kobayashii]GCE18352.1 alpha/beta hydrolase [Dictyobacter kobayashii]
MKGKRWLLAGAAVAASMACYTTTYRNWRQKEISRLAAGSNLIDTRLGPIEYNLSGTGPVILIAHGSPGGYDMGQAFAKLFNNLHYSYLAVSRPGYLRTPLETAPTPEEQADLYAALLDMLAIDQVSILGISGGGPSAIQFALRHPERCSSLVMISGVAQHYSEQEIWQSYSPLKRISRQIYSKIVAFDPFIYFVLPFAGLQPAGAAATDLVRTALLYSHRKRGYDNDMEQFEKISRYPLQNIKAPTFIVHGTSDDEVLFADAELLASQAPLAQILVIPNGTHMAFYTHADIVMPALEEFLQRTIQLQAAS